MNSRHSTPFKTERRNPNFPVVSVKQEDTTFGDFSFNDDAGWQGKVQSSGNGFGFRNSSHRTNTYAAEDIKPEQKVDIKCGVGRGQGSRTPAPTPTTNPSYSDMVKNYVKQEFGLDRGTSNFSWGGEPDSQKFQNTFKTPQKSTTNLTLLKQYKQNIVKLVKIIPTKPSASMDDDLEEMNLILDIIADPQATRYYEDVSLEPYFEKCLQLLRRYPDAATIYPEDVEADEITLKPQLDFEEEEDEDAWKNTSTIKHSSVIKSEPVHVKKEVKEESGYTCKIVTQTNQVRFEPYPRQQVQVKTEESRDTWQQVPVKTQEPRDTRQQVPVKTQDRRDTRQQVPVKTEEPRDTRQQVPVKTHQEPRDTSFHSSTKGSLPRPPPAPLIRQAMTSPVNDRLLKKVATEFSPRKRHADNFCAPLSRAMPSTSMNTFKLNRPRSRFSKEEPGSD